MVPLNRVSSTPRLAASETARAFPNPPGNSRRFRLAQLLRWVVTTGWAFFGTLPAMAATTTVLPFDSQHRSETNSFQCTAIGMGDVILIRARFESDLSGMRTFSTFFEAIPGRAFNAGQKMSVTVAGVNVGTVKLRPIVGGDVASEMQLNNAPIFGDHTKPFPSQFPEIARNTRVAVSAGGKLILGCRLE
jgi:hypothetical protein